MSNEEKTLLTRAEIEERLERGLVGKVLSFERIDGTPYCGKLQRLAVEYLKGELMVSFMLDKQRFQADLQYFVENTTIRNGDSQRTDSRSIRRILKGDR